MSDYASELAERWFWGADGKEAIEGAIREALAKAAEAVLNGDTSDTGTIAANIRALGAKPRGIVTPCEGDV